MQQQQEPKKKFCLVTGHVMDDETDCWNNVVDERFEEIAWFAIRYDFAFLNESDRHVYIDAHIFQYIACMYDGISYKIRDVEQLFSVLPRTVSYWTREKKAADHPLIVPCSEKNSDQRLFQVQEDYWNYLKEWGMNRKLDVEENWKLTPLYKRLRDHKYTWKNFPFNVPGSPYYNPSRAVPISLFYHELKHLQSQFQVPAAKVQAQVQAQVQGQCRLPADYIPTIIRQSDGFALNFK